MMGEGEIVGYRFSPSDAELVGHYLANKIKGNESKVFPIVEVDLCKNEPWDLPKITERQGIRSRSQVWYFFCARVSKYNNSKRANRTTVAGFWKATGKDRNVSDPDTNRKIGVKKTLVFYRGRVPHGVRTTWVIHEYRLSDPKQDAYVICKMKKKSDKNLDSFGDRGEPSQPPPSDNENYAPRNTILEEIPHPQIQPHSQINADDYLASLNDHNVLDHDWGFKLPDEGISLSDLDSTDFSAGQNGSQQQFYVPEEQEELDPEFVNALFADEDESPRGETVHSFRNGYSQSMSVTGGVYFENNSDTDAEILHGRSGRILEATGSSKGPSSSSQHKQMHVEDVFYGDEIWERDSFSELSHTTSTNVEPFVTINTSKSKYQPEVHEFVRQESPKRFQLREHKCAPRNQAKEVSEQVTSRDLPQKKISMKNSEKQQKMVKVSYAQNQTIAKAVSLEPVSREGKGPFIFFQESRSRYEPSPPSLYIGNVILGLFLFIIIVREVIYCH